RRTKRRKPPAEASAGAVAAVSVERRAGAKGNTHQQSTYWTQSQGRVSKALERIRRLVPLPTRGRSRMRESRTYGSWREACDETHVPTATASRFHHAAWRRGSSLAARGARACGASGFSCPIRRTTPKWASASGHFGKNSQNLDGRMAQRFNSTSVGLPTTWIACGLRRQV